MFFRYLAQELRFSSCSLLTSCLLVLELLGEFWSFRRWDDLERANSLPNLEVKGVSRESASSSSSSSLLPRPMVAELLLLASLAFLSFSAAYRDRPLGYWSSPEILREAETDSSGVGLFWDSAAIVAEVLDFAKYLLTKLSESSLLLYLLEYPVPLSELSSLLNLLSESLELDGSGEVYLLYLRELPGLIGAACCSGS